MMDVPEAWNRLRTIRGLNFEAMGDPGVVDAECLHLWNGRSHTRPTAVTL